MKINEIIKEASDSYQPPELKVGDEVMTGKFKNRKAEITGFKKDKNQHPVLKTNKGDVQLFKPRIKKLIDKGTSNEVVTEKVSVESDTGKISRLALKIATLLDPFASKPLIFREFKSASTAVIVKVTADSEPRAIRSGHNDRQSKLLAKLAIEHPTFCTTALPSGGWSAFGNGHIVIPPSNATMHWSPIVQDIGSSMVVGPTAKKYGREDLGGGMSRSPSGNRLVGPELSKTYKTGWPPEGFANEVIIDSPDYYMLNLKEFISKAAGKDASVGLYGGYQGRAIQKEVFNSKFRHYGDIATYLRTTFQEYLKNKEENNES